MHNIQKADNGHSPEHKIDDSIACSCGREHTHIESRNFSLIVIRLATAMIFTLIAWLAGRYKTDCFNIVSVIIYVVAYLLAGYEVIINAGKNISRGKLFDENFLMTFASLGAFAIGDLLEAVTVMIFYGVGELLQELAVARSRKNISAAMDIRPDFANLKIRGGIKTVSPQDIKIGDTIIIKPGERVPLDGTITNGESFLDTSALTGETVPVRAGVGNDIYSGCVNTSGLLEVIVTKCFAESTVSRVLELVSSSSAKKARSEKFITKFAAVYTPSVVFGAVAVALLPPLFGFGTYSQWFYKALSFLIISCPCALVISIPISFFGGIGGAAKHGILIKGGNFLEALNSAKTIVFDKTGTLTKGVFSVCEVCPQDTITKNELLRLAAVCEANSNHPIAKSILSAYKGEKLPNAQISETPGLGITADINGDIIAVGNAKLMAQIGIEELPVFAKTTVYVAKNGEYCGYILISDKLRGEAKEAIIKLKQLGMRLFVMLTGDNDAIAKEVSKELNIDEYHSGLLPQDKVSEFEKLLISEKRHGKVIYVGDGINDAPVLSRSDIGIAMGGIGSDAAIEAADIVIMNDDISKLVTAFKIAKKTRYIVFENIIFAMAVKIIIMVLAFLGLTSIWFAIFADVGVALLALLNAVRAMRFRG